MAGIFLFLSGSVAFADELDISQFGLSFNADNQILSGEWPGVVAWHRRLCDGYYRYDVKFNARLEEDTGFEFNEDNSVTIHAHFTNIWAGADGAWKSQYTLCREVPGWLGVGSDWVKADARIVFPHSETDKLTSVSVDILGTEFGPMHLGKYVPGWMEREAQELLQREFPKFWQRHLRDWVNGYLQKRAAERFNRNL